MIRSYKTSAIILSRRNIGEADKLVTLFTREYGKLVVVAKGVRRLHSRRAPHLEPFMQVVALLSKRNHFDMLQEVSTVETFSLLRTRLERVGYAYIALELTERFTAEHQESRFLFEELLTFLKILNDVQTSRKTATQALFLYKKELLSELGFLDPHKKVDEELIDRHIADVLETQVKSATLLTNIQMNL